MAAMNFDMMKMNISKKLFVMGVVVVLAACQSPPPPTATPPPPTSAEQAQALIKRLKTEADALRKLDVLGLEGTVGFPSAKRSRYQEKIRRLAFGYAAQYRKDLGRLLDLPRRAVEDVFEPLLQAESAVSPGGGMYQTMHLHLRAARVSSQPLWWDHWLFWNRVPRSAVMAEPSLMNIMQDYQALRYLTTPGELR